ncbi:uncharacterized protein LOC127243699 [Andrographis paniculata]|uniref:uncharacterized protein LOC127243699 n=1 Tax=Andrographis paniculata TaxID=175694 RepID=UPI0021E9485F|nr:uncharacterized protein LOC127243699 [Andrographis paniculata]
MVHNFCLNGKNIVTVKLRLWPSRHLHIETPSENEGNQRMVGRSIWLLLKNRSAAAAAPLSSAAPGQGKSNPWARKLVSGALICLVGGVALSALDDLAIYHSCSKKALEKASKNQAIVEAIGEPIERGPWYNASLAVAHKRHSVACTFPVSGPQGSGIFQLKAVRNGEDTLFSILRPRDWEILIMEALVHVPGNEQPEQTFRISVSDSPPPDFKLCTSCTPQPSEIEGNNQLQTTLNHSQQEV